MLRLRSAGLLGFVVAVVSTPLAAQDATARHRGFWISFGAGVGWNTTDNTSGATGGAGYLRLGGSPSPRFLVGGEAIGWALDVGGATISRGNATVSLQFYPSRGGGFFLKGGVGGSSVQSASTTGNTTVTVTDTGFGTTLGVGFDIRLGRNFYLTPNVDFLGQRIDDADNTLLLLTVGATWH
jgi:hypothetical protein